MWVPVVRTPDAELVSRARAGERAAFATLIERHYPALLGSCRRALRDGDRARDAAQEAALIALLGLRRLREASSFGAWLIGIGLNVCRAMVRAPPLEPLPPELAGVLDPSERAEAREFAGRVRGAISRLPQGQREAVTLFYLAGLTHTEVAAELATRPGAVKTRLHKARASLRAPLNDLWKEYFTMPTDTATEFVPMRVADLRRAPAEDAHEFRHILLLHERAGERRLPIWIGRAEAAALVVILEQVELPRPGAYHFAAALLQATGGELREVRIVELTDAIFYAQAVLADGGAIDARPSDAVTLALLLGKPILVAERVLEQGATSPFVKAADRASDGATVLAEEERARIARLSEAPTPTPEGESPTPTV
jgi:RNA polymerase sigma factor (sigma-70 family)